jgi:alpha-glucosidase
MVVGPRYVLAATPMDRIPLYARGGAVIAMWPSAPQSTAHHHPSEIELHVFVPVGEATHVSMLQEDDGVTRAALDGARYRTTFALTRRRGAVALQARVDGDGYPEFARQAFRLVIHGARPAILILNGTRVQAGDRGFLIPNHGQDFTAEFDV